MNSLGIDLHCMRSHVAAFDEHGGELFSRRIVNDPVTFVALLGELGESWIALEATYRWEGLASCWRTTATSCTWFTRCGQGDRFGAGEDGHRRRAHARPLVAS